MALQWSQHIAACLAVMCTLGAVSAKLQPPQPCGSLDLTSALTQHCFPADGALFSTTQRVSTAPFHALVPA